MDLHESQYSIMLPQSSHKLNKLHYVHTTAVPVQTWLYLTESELWDQIPQIAEYLHLTMC